MNRVAIDESGMRFGPYEQENFFHIEKTNFYNKINTNVKVVEFMVIDYKNRLILVEAKSSAPSPLSAEHFDEYINDICDKFLHSINMLFSMLSKRLDDRELPKMFKQVNYSTIDIILCLVIKQHKAEWIPPINDALTKRIQSYKKIWRLEIITLNEEMSYEQRLINRAVKMPF